MSDLIDREPRSVRTALLFLRVRAGEPLSPPQGNGAGGSS